MRASDTRRVAAGLVNDDARVAAARQRSSAVAECVSTGESRRFSVRYLATLPIRKRMSLLLALLVGGRLAAAALAVLALRVSGFVVPPAPLVDHRLPSDEAGLHVVHRRRRPSSRHLVIRFLLLRLRLLGIHVGRRPRVVDVLPFGRFVLLVGQRLYSLYRFRCLNCRRLRFRRLRRRRLRRRRHARFAGAAASWRSTDVTRWQHRIRLVADLLLFASYRLLLRLAGDPPDHHALRKRRLLRSLAVGRRRRLQKRRPEVVERKLARDAVVTERVLSRFESLFVGRLLALTSFHRVLHRRLLLLFARQRRRVPASHHAHVVSRAARRRRLLLTRALRPRHVPQKTSPLFLSSRKNVAVKSSAANYRKKNVRAIFLFLCFIYLCFSWYDRIKEEIHCNAAAVVSLYYQRSVAISYFDCAVTSPGCTR